LIFTGLVVQVYIEIICLKNSISSRAVEPPQEQFWMAGAGAKIFLMVEPEPEPEI